jgi:hypothetical protein
MGGDIQICLMSDILEELTVIPITIWQLSKFKERMSVRKQTVQKYDVKIIQF